MVSAAQEQMSDFSLFDFQLQGKKQKFNMWDVRDGQRSVGLIRIL